MAVARHIDECSRCASSAAAGEPLANAFASVSDPEVPEHLSDEIVAAARDAFPEVQPDEDESDSSSIAIFLIAAAILLAVIVSPMGVADGTQTALVGMAHKSEETLGRNGAIGLGIAFCLGALFAVLLYKYRRD